MNEVKVVRCRVPKVVCGYRSVNGVCVVMSRYPDFSCVDAECELLRVRARARLLARALGEDI
jgi:hypothetical protein